MSLFALKPKSSITSFLTRFASDTRGSYAVLMAGASVCILACVGTAVDGSLLRKTNLQLQTQADIISLAVAKEGLSTPAELKTHAASLLATNAPGQAISVTDISRAGDDYTVELSLPVKTTFMQMFVSGDIDVNARSVTTYGKRNLDLALVLDNTGSMKGPKLKALKQASNALVDILYDGSTASSGTQIGLVPFAQWVNVGSQYKSAAWLDQNGKSFQNETYFDRDVSRFDLYASLGVDWNGCVENRLPPFDVDDTAPDPRNPQTLFQPAFHPDMKDGDRWGYTYVADIAGGSALDQLRATDKYRAPLSGSASGPAYAVDSSCSDKRRKITPMTNKKGVIKSAINSMYAQGYTNIANGASWGFRVVSPNAPFTQGRAYADKSTQKAMVILTDGEQTIGGPRGDFDSGYTPFGFLGEPAVRGKTRLTGSNAKAALDAKLSEVCAAAKAKGVIVYTITFELNDKDTKSLMRDCASSPSLYFDAKRASELTPAFKAIASSLGELRISG